jgi:hypothetical protein
LFAFLGVKIQKFFEDPGSGMETVRLSRIRHTVRNTDSRIRSRIRSRNYYLEVRFQIRISRVINTLRYGSGSVPKISRIRIDNSFLIFRILKAHLFVSKHLSNDALVYCSTCDKSFELQTSLYVHRQAHHKTTKKWNIRIICLENLVGLLSKLQKCFFYIKTFIATCASF